MKLKLYLVENKISIKYFSELIGCSRGHLNGVVNGKIRIGKALAQLIEIKTNGKVKAEELLRGD